MAKIKQERYNNYVIEKYKSPLAFLLLGVLLFGGGVLGGKILNLNTGPEVEILGEEIGGDLPAEILVEAAGEILHPGVYQLKIGSRVNDLLIAAGGLSAEADRDWVAKNINLVQKLSDGAKIYIPGKAGPPTGGVGQKSKSGFISEKINKFVSVKININTVSASELESLWGVGPATSQKIIQNRPYQRIEELLEKKIVKSNVWEEIKDKIIAY